MASTNLLCPETAGAKTCYIVRPDIVQKMREARERTGTRQLEQGFALCTEQGSKDLQVEDECQGDNCSIRNARCGITKPKVANFHTHPYTRKPYSFVATEPSFGDLVSQTSEAFNGRSQGVECIASNQTDTAQCWILRKRVDGDQMRRLTDAYHGQQHALGKTAWNRTFGAGSYEEYWGTGPGAEIDLKTVQVQQQPPRPPMPQVERFTAKDYRRKLAAVKTDNAILKNLAAAKKELRRPYVEEARKVSRPDRLQIAELRRKIKRDEAPFLDGMKHDTAAVNGNYDTVQGHLDTLGRREKTTKVSRASYLSELYGSVQVFPERPLTVSRDRALEARRRRTTKARRARPRFMARETELQRMLVRLMVR